jgi:hypothetical protein
MNLINFLSGNKQFNNNVKKYLLNLLDLDLSYELSESEKINKKKDINKKKNHYKGKKKRNLKTGFYWEDLDQKYPYDPKLKYCIYFRGCCCPPHKGHIDSIRDAVKNFNECKIIINQVCSLSRHGTPVDFNSELLQKYLKAVFPNKEISYMLKSSSDQVFKNDFVLDSDVLLIIRGDEIDSNNFNKQYIVDMQNKNREIKMKKYIEFLNKHEIKVDFIMQKRNVNKVSATKFIEKINIYKDKLSKNKDTKKELLDLMKYIPNELNYDEKNEIINQIIKYNTW